MKKLTRKEMKNLQGGDAEILPVDDDNRCLGCTTDRECAAVNKGTCTKDCVKGGKGCSGW